MRLRNSKERYGAIHQLLHWAMAAMVIGAIVLGLAEMQYGIHKSLGISVLALVGLRILWRWVNPTPELPKGMSRFQRMAAHGAHLLLYLLMIAMPVCGWLMSNAAGKTVSLWGYYDLPALVEKNKAFGKIMHEAHEIGGNLFIAVIALHFLATLHHQFILRDGLLWRMLPSGRKRAAALGLSQEEKQLIEKAPWQ